MPELPEVQTVRVTLEKELINDIIIKVDDHYSKLIINDVLEFKKLICGQKINRIDRKGKYLIFILDSHVMIIHLRMEGKFYIKLHEKVEKHEHIVFHLKSGRTLRYHDVRKFGTITLLDIKNYLNVPPLSVLGKEPKDSNLDVVFEKLQRKKIAIKSSLLDQHLISGLGNIYVDEVLFLSKIHPLRSAYLVTKKQLKTILESSIKVLDKAIELGGTTIRSYTSSLGVHGRFQNELKVHLRKDKPCLVCNMKIVKLRVGGRGTYICPKCQYQPVIIGLTGGISGGKTTAIEHFKKLGVKAIDCDLIVRDLYQTNKEMNEKIAKAFGFSINDLTDRKRLGNIIFNDTEKRRELNEIVHPYVFLEIERQKKDCDDEKIIIIDMPLLIEVGYQELCDYVIVINIEKPIQIERLMERSGLTEKEAILRIDSQFPLFKKINKADIVFDNNKTKSDLYQQIDLFLKRYMR